LLCQTCVQRQRSIRLRGAQPWQVAAQEEISQGQKSEKKDAGIVVVKRSVSQDTYKKGYEGSAQTEIKDSDLWRRFSAGSAD
jgi:hypothetical protein